METLMATVVFIPLSLLVVEAAFSAPVYPTTILGSLTTLKNDLTTPGRDYNQRPIQNEDSIGQSEHVNPVTEHLNLQYFTGINIGHTPQLFRAAIDISFSDLFVFSTQCQTEVCEGHYRYNSSCSTTYQENGTETLFEHLCLRGESFLSKDTLHVAGIEIKDQMFHELPDVHEMPAGPYTTYFDAVLGLAPGNEQSLANIPNPFQNMISQGLLERNVISFALPSSGLGWGYPGEIMYGDINHNQYIGDLNYVPLSNAYDPDRGPNNPLVNGSPVLNGTWRVEARALFWGNSIDEFYDLSGFAARFDTAEFFISLPLPAYKKLCDIIPHVPVFPPDLKLVDCEQRDALPNLTFLLGDYNFSISAYQYTLEMMMGEYERRCILGIEPRLDYEVDDHDMIVLGSGFLRGFYSVFDYDEKRVGFGYTKQTAEALLSAL